MTKLSGNGVATASPNANNSNNAWNVNFNNGNDNNNKNNNQYVRLVRPESEHAPFGLRQLDSAYRSCRKRKRNKVRTCLYEQNLLDNLVNTQQQLQAWCWQPKPPVAFVVTRPKAREVFAAQFEDRVVHHLLVNQLEPLMENEFIFDAASNRKNKGTHFAVARLQHFMRQLSQANTECSESACNLPKMDGNGVEPAGRTCRSDFSPTKKAQRWTKVQPTKEDAIVGLKSNPPGGKNFCGSGFNPTAYFLQLDIANFFNSIHHQMLLRLINQKLDKWLRKNWITPASHQAYQWLCDVIVSQTLRHHAICLGRPSDFDKVPVHKRLAAVGEGLGLPIGNLTSQFFANVYMNELDQFVKHQLKCKHYIRYVDDFILCHPDQQVLEQWHRQIAGFVCQRLKLTLKPAFVLAPLGNGADFLGYIVKPHYRPVRKRVLGNLHEKLIQLEMQLFQSDPRPGACVEKTGAFIHAAPALLEKLDATLNSYWGHFSHANSFTLKQSLLKRYQWLNWFYQLGEQGELLPIYRANNCHTFAGQMAYFRQFYPGKHLMVQLEREIALWRAADTDWQKYPINSLKRFRRCFEKNHQGYVFCAEQRRKRNGLLVRQVRLIALIGSHCRANPTGIACVGCDVSFPGAWEPAKADFLNIINQEDKKK